jgi:hypothetical protein
VKVLFSPPIVNLDGTVSAVCSLAFALLPAVELSLLRENAELAYEILVFSSIS